MLSRRWVHRQRRQRRASASILKESPTFTRLWMKRRPSPRYALGLERGLLSLSSKRAIRSPSWILRPNTRHRRLEHSLLASLSVIPFIETIALHTSGPSPLPNTSRLLVELGYNTGARFEGTEPTSHSSPKTTYSRREARSHTTCSRSRMRRLVFLKRPSGAA